MSSIHMPLMFDIETVFQYCSNDLMCYKKRLITFKIINNAQYV